MLTRPAAFTPFQQSTAADRHLIVKVDDGATVWLFSDVDMQLTDGHVYPLLTRRISIAQSIDLYTRQWRISDVRLTLNNADYLGTGAILSDEWDSILNATVTLYLAAGGLVTGLSDCLVRFVGTLTTSPAYSVNQIQLRAVDSTKATVAILPQNLISSVFPAAPAANRSKLIPLVYGEFIYAVDNATDTGLAVAIQIDDNVESTWVVSDHILNQIDASHTKLNGFLDPTILEDTTFDADNSGRGTFTLVLPGAPSIPRNFEANTRVRPIDDYSGAYDQSVPDTNVTNLGNAFDGKSTTYAELLDYIDEGTDDGDSRHCRILVAFNTHVTGGPLENDVGDIITISGANKYILELLCVTDDAALTFSLENAFIYYRQTDGTDQRATLTDPVVVNNNLQDINVFWGQGSASSAVFDPTYAGSGPNDMTSGGSNVGADDDEITVTIDRTSAGNISSFADAGANVHANTDADHNLIVGDIVSILGTTNYNGFHTVLIVGSSTQFTFLDTFVATDTGTWSSSTFEWVARISGLGKKAVQITGSSQAITTGITVDFSSSTSARSVGDEWIFKTQGVTDLREDFAFHLRQHSAEGSSIIDSEGSFPLVLYMEFETDPNVTQTTNTGDGVSLNETLIRVYDIRLNMRHRVKTVENGFAGCEGREYGSWITGRSSNYADGQFIKDPAGIIESILRDELGLVDADIDLVSFINAENTSIEARINFHDDNTMDSNKAIRQLCEQSTFSFIYSSSGKAKLIDMSDTTPTTATRGSHPIVIPYSHIKQGSISVKKEQKIFNDITYESRWMEDRGQYIDIDTVTDAASITSFGLKEYKARWKNVAGTHAAAIAAFLVGSDGIWSNQHNVVTLETLGYLYADLEFGDWFELDPITVDPHVLLFGSSWSGRQFLPISLTQLEDSTKIVGIQLFG